MRLVSHTDASADIETCLSNMEPPVTEILQL